MRFLLYPCRCSCSTFISNRPNATTVPTPATPIKPGKNKGYEALWAFSPAREPANLTAVCKERHPRTNYAARLKCP